MASIWYVNPSRKLKRAKRVRKNPLKRNKLGRFIKKAKFRSNPKEGKMRKRRRMRRNPFSGLAKAIHLEHRALREHEKKRAKRKRKPLGAKGRNIVRGRIRKRFAAALAARKSRKGKMGKRKSAKRVAAGKKAARTRKARAAARRATRKGKRRVSRKGKSKSSKRSRAAKKAARTRAANKARRRAAARRAARKRRSAKGKRGHRSMAKSRRRKSRRRFKGLRSLKRARRAIKRGRRGGRRARAYIRHYRMRTNPSSVSGVVGVVKDVVKAALPVAAGFYASRVISAQSGRVDFLNKLGQHRDPVVSVGVVAGLAFLANKVSALSKYKSQILMGAGMHVVDVLLKTYLPQVAGQLGVGEYVRMGEYIEYPGMAGYDYELGDDSMVDLADYPSQVASVPTGHMLAPAANYEDVAMNDLYSGVFAGSMLS